ncbi:K+-transporting ATPase ATPase C chain [Sphingomonas zeicaulis]|uniref:potassium-transporting ATPase subunit KdpC n=1 Tax=Sphingomonas zeicaulis TaxID=1632740 RepID=UPI003D1F37DA
MTKDLLSAFRPAIVLTLLFALLLGILYPLAITGIGQAIFPWQANGSLVVAGSKPVGSAIVGQTFTSPGYFWSRPSAAGDGYNGLSSSGSNLGPTSAALVERVKGDLAARADGAKQVPADLVTASGSGLDPDISPAAALRQVPRVAAARGLNPAAVRALVERSVQTPVPAFLGDPTVNVLALNRALDAMTPAR